MNIADIKKMSTAERLQTMEALWDSLLYENGQIESPKWHEKIIEKRKAKIKSGKAKFISLSELKASR
jgi:putative addiction module component (TIGR02574 family)